MYTNDRPPRAGANKRIQMGQRILVDRNVAGKAPQLDAFLLTHKTHLRILRICRRST